MDSEPVPTSTNQKEPQIYVPATIDLSDAPGVPEENWRDENNKWKYGLVFVSASGRYNGRLLNYTQQQIEEIKHKYQRLWSSHNPTTRNQIPNELFTRRMEKLKSQIIRSGNFEWCPEDFVIIDSNTKEGQEFLSRAMQTNKAQNEENQKK